MALEIGADTVAVITGGGSGIGLAFGRAVVSRGGSVVLADVDEAALSRAGAELSAGGAAVLTAPTDVSDAAQVQALADATVDRFGRADLVVNNAGVIAWNAFDRLSLDEWRWVVDVNLFGVIHGLHAFLPVLRAHGGPGHFVNVSSVGGVLADTPFMSTYSATKGAVIGLSLTLAQELAMVGSPIGVTILCPSNTADTHVLDAERNRPAAAPHAERAPGVDALVEQIRGLVDNGQPVDVLVERTLAAVAAGDLWVFPHPDSAPMIQPRLDALGAVLDRSAQQPIG